MKIPTTTLLLVLLMTLSCQESDPTVSEDQPVLTELHEQNIKTLIGFFDKNDQVFKQ